MLFFGGDVKLSTPHVTCWHQRHQLQHPQNGKKHPKLCECETRHATNYGELLVFTLPETITASSHLKLGLFSPQIWKWIIFQPLRKSGAKMLVSSSSFHKGRKSLFQEFWNWSQPYRTRKNVQNQAICGQEDNPPVAGYPFEIHINSGSHLFRDFFSGL